MQQYPSQLLERAVEAFSQLPGVGRKTALRLVLHLLRQPIEDVDGFAEAVLRVKHDVKHCKVCHNISDNEVCTICTDPRRDASLVCVVENVQDVMAIENTQQFHGLYHVLGGIISPMDGIGPEDINIPSLIERLKDEEVKELILAMNPNLEGESTAMYISRLVKPIGIKVTRLAQGLSVGGDLEYADEVTLSRAIAGRTEM